MRTLILVGGNNNLCNGAATIKKNINDIINHFLIV